MGTPLPRQENCRPPAPPAFSTLLPDWISPEKAGKALPAIIVHGAKMAYAGVCLV